MSIFNFFVNQMLKMTWLSNLTTSFVENILNLDVNTKLGGSIQFFIYDTIKIFILLAVLIFLISYIQSYFPPERTKKILTKFKGIMGATVSALLGTVTPFCSCSSIPIFIGFSNAGLPLGITFSFLISSPMVDLASLLLLTGFFGVNVSILYVVLGLIIAIIGGTIISKMNLEDQIQTYSEHTKELYAESESFNQKQRLSYAKKDILAIIKNVYKYVIVGVDIGALIHNWIPKEAILAFMMSVTTLSLPSMIMLSKVIKPKLLAIFIGIVTIGIIITGYLFNTIEPFLM